MMIYCAIIGDIVSSKKIQDREQVQTKFKKVINDLNKRYFEHIASRFTVTLGDEFQGLLNTPYISYDIIMNIKEEMKPHKMVFGIGIGEMNTSFSKDISIGSDGPAYHYARNMVIRAKKKKPSICYYSNSMEDELINSLIYFIETCEKKHTVTQKQVVELYRKNKSQLEVALILNKNQSTISRILKNAMFDEINNAEEEIVNFLRKKHFN